MTFPSFASPQLQIARWGLLGFLNESVQQHPLSLVLGNSTRAIRPCVDVLRTSHNPCPMARHSAARFWAEPIGERFSKVGTYDLYRVACNLLNGLPPRYRDDDPAGTSPKR